MALAQRWIAIVNDAQWIRFMEDNVQAAITIMSDVIAFITTL
jgi:hypothetical protein